MNYYSMPRVKKRNALIEPSIGRVCNKPKSFLFDFTARVANVPDTFVPPIERDLRQRLIDDVCRLRNSSASVD